MTDDATGLDAGIDARPLPDFDDPGGPERGWRKISTFRRPLFDLEGPTLFLDIDIVIVGNIDCLFSHPGEFLIIKDWARPWRPTGNSSVYRFEAGAHPELLAKFMTEHAAIRREVRNEQEYISRELHRAGKLSYWPREWCVSFKYQCMAKFPMNWWIPPNRIRPTRWRASRRRSQGTCTRLRGSRSTGGRALARLAAARRQRDDSATTRTRRSGKRSLGS
jgi:hypothetical protein